MPDESTAPKNRLAGETSPYLLQHSTNPVDWYPWGEEALRRARDLNRPIFLSIGYSSCHWCHVMERESFEDPDIARTLNEHFVSIKVDREERPDLDAIYMEAVQALTGSGGWPLSVFLTPDLRPFWGGTYFPPEDRYGRPGFGRILLHLAALHESSRDRVDAAAREITEAIRREWPIEERSDLPGEGVFAAAVRHAVESFDAHHGGFGSAPKFPRAVEISLLLRRHARSGAPDVLHICEKTLEGMASGGMYDQVGGGFHRYSTDAAWLVPHFEKMLYDNALLARTYTEAFRLTGKEAYAATARDVLDYVLREMTAPEGGFYSATDADSEGEEGKFFVWTPEEVEAVVGSADARIVCERFGITPGGNFERSTSIPHAARPPEAVARALGVPLDEVRAALARSRAGLYEARKARVPPLRDEKVLASWNGLMISALARAHQTFDEPRYLEAARRCVDLIFREMVSDGRLLRSWKDGVAKVPAYLDDHALLAEGLLDLWESEFAPDDLRRARGLMDVLLEHFWDDSGAGFYFTASYHEPLIARKKDVLDGSTPSGNGVAALNLLRLERITGRAEYRQKAESLLRALGGSLERLPSAMSSAVIALDFLRSPPVEVALVGDLRSPEGRDLLRAVRREFLPGMVVVAAADPVPAEIARLAPLLEGKRSVDGRPTAYVCRDFACRAPVTTPDRLACELRAASSSSAADSPPR